MDVAHEGHCPHPLVLYPAATSRATGQVAMRILLNVVAALCLLVGCVWILQGINVLPGSFMTGQMKWAIYGALLVLAAVVLLVFANRRRQGAA